MGKIYQISDFDSFIKKHKDILVICTFKEVDHQNISFACNSFDLTSLLFSISKDTKNVLIYSMSTIIFTDKIYNLMQMINSKGFDVYVHSFSNKKLWYVDLEYKN